MEQTWNNFISTITSANIIISILIVVGAFVLWFVIKKAIAVHEAKTNADGKSTKNNGAFRSLANVIRIVVVIVVVLAILQINGVNVSTLVASLGITGAVIGLAIQDFLKDIIMGSHIKSDNFFGVGDIVKFGDYEGEVVFYNLKTTKIRDFSTGNIINICNREITSIQKVSNQMDIDVGIDYSKNYKDVDEVMGRICERIGEMKHVSSVKFKGTQSFDESWVLYKIRFMGSARRKPDMLREANRIVQEEMNRAGMDFAYSHLDISIQK